MDGPTAPRKKGSSSKRSKTSDSGNYTTSTDGLSSNTSNMNLNDQPRDDPDEDTPTPTQPHRKKSGESSRLGKKTVAEDFNEYKSAKLAEMVETKERKQLALASKLKRDEGYINHLNENQKNADLTFIEQASSPLSAQLLEFCESELFPETIQNSEVASSSNCCYDDHSSYTTNLSFPPDIIKYPTPAPATDDNNFSIIFDEEITENDINSVNLDFTTSPNLNLPPYQFTSQDQFDFSLLQNQIPLNDHNNPILPYPSDHGVPIIGPTLPTVCEDDSLSSMPPSKFMRFNNNHPSSLNCSFMDPSITSYLSGNTNPPLPLETSGIFNGDLFLGELDFKGDNNGIFCLDPLPRPYNSNELQAHSNESQHLVTGGGSSATPLASEITSLEAETFRVTNKLTTEERKEKIHRYLKKRNERNFSKKIKYACRKTLADSRPRVRGRFAKNDEFGEINRGHGHEEDTAEDVKSFHVVVKEEDENFESSDIFAHISGVNSFKCNYPIQSWI
ncbi:uncharacterized protein LOC143539805 [Bidens hawaiensis]|uniref:uncharacterized protein LOC143539805 n=1 Tax=Bidens hawaiensis TaxID=980011 RepID=UPI0040491E0D